MPDDRTHVTVDWSCGGCGARATASISPAGTLPKLLTALGRHQCSRREPPQDQAWLRTQSEINGGISRRPKGDRDA